MQWQLDYVVEMPTPECTMLPRAQRASADLAFFKNGQYTESFAVPTKCSSVHRSVKEVQEVSKGASAGIVINLYPHTTVGLASSLQRKCDIAKLSPTARI